MFYETSPSDTFIIEIIIGVPMIVLLVGYFILGMLLPNDRKESEKKNKKL